MRSWALRPASRSTMETFQLSDDGIDTPKQQLIACAPHDSFLVLNNGNLPIFHDDRQAHARAGSA